MWIYVLRKKTFVYIFWFIWPPLLLEWLWEAKKIYNWKNKNNNKVLYITREKKEMTANDRNHKAMTNHPSLIRSCLLCLVKKPSFQCFWKASKLETNLISGSSRGAMTQKSTQDGIPLIDFPTFYLEHENRNNNSLF